MAERLECKSPECNNTIGRQVALRTGGICWTCICKMEAGEREDFIRKLRIQSEPYEGVTDPVDVIKIYHELRRCFPLLQFADRLTTLEELYCDLDSEQASQLLTNAISLHQGANERGKNSADDIAIYLTAFTEHTTEPYLEILAAENNFYPDYLFLRASDEIRDKILSLTAGDGGILVALAWIGDDRSVAQFAQWRESPPSWSADFYVPIEKFAHFAGWELTDRNERRDLYYDTCFEMTKCLDGETVDTTIGTASAVDEKCPYCNHTTTHLIDLDLSDPRFAFLDWPFPRLQVLCCEFCVCYTDFLFSVVDDEGIARLSPDNKRPEWLPDDSDVCGNRLQGPMRLAANPRPAYYAASPYLPTPSTQIGGLPCWVQDSAYPECPKCNQTMTFVAQLDCEDIEEYGEGTYYMFACKDCGMTATTYQQT